MDNKLKYYRKLYGYSQQQIADKINVSQQTYAYFELEKRKISKDCIVKLCKLYGVTFDELFSTYKNSIYLDYKNYRKLVDHIEDKNIGEQGTTEYEKVTILVNKIIKEMFED